MIFSLSGAFAPRFRPQQDFNRQSDQLSTVQIALCLVYNQEPLNKLTANFVPTKICHIIFALPGKTETMRKNEPHQQNCSAHGATT